MVREEYTELTSSHGRTESTALYGKISFKKTRDWRSDPFTSGKQERNHTEWIGKAENYPHKSLPVQQPVIKRECKTWSFTLRSDPFVSHIRHPNF